MAANVEHREQAAVVLVDLAGGRELAVVQDLLAAMATPTVLIGAEDLDGGPLGWDADPGLLDIAERRVRPAVVWLRHASAAALVARTSRGPLDAAVWAGFLAQVAAAAGTALPGRAALVADPLADAGRLGLTVPRTVVTTDAAAGARALRAPRVIVKTPDFRLHEPDRDRWAACLPVVLDRDSVPAGRAARPLTVQEYVPHERELRVYHLDGGVCAFEVVTPDPATPWTDPARVTVTRVECPAAVAAAVRRLAAAWRLLYAAFDLLVTGTGETVLLEVNPDGDWLWYERKACWHGVSLLAAVMIRQLYLAATSEA